MQEEINENLKKLGTWKRIFFMIVFAVLIGLIRLLLWAVVFLQVVSTLLTGSSNKNILSFGKSLSAYTYHILLFLTFNTDVIPFPFSAWQITEELDLPKIKQDS